MHVGGCRRSVKDSDLKVELLSVYSPVVNSEVKDPMIKDKMSLRCNNMRRVLPNTSGFYFQKLGICLLVTALQILEGCSAVVHDTDDDNVLHIGGIFPIGGKGGWQGGQVC